MRCWPVRAPIARICTRRRRQCGQGRNRRHPKIRLAYLCGEFREHPIGFLTAGLFELHDKSKFEITALDSGGGDGSATRKRHEAAFDKFIDITKLSDEAVAEKIRAEEIDILVDVNGYTRNHRMGVVRAQAGAPPGELSGHIPARWAPPPWITSWPTGWSFRRISGQYYTENIVYLPDSY